ncbi:MAG TPA: helicase-related protein [Longimicrobiales bacterium]|nr:helicase-related protein [Longimicrobiales bacterium]
MQPDNSWETLVREVAATLVPEERVAVVEWAAKAPPSARNRDALLDRAALERFGRAAAIFGARFIPASRVLELGDAEVEAMLDGKRVTRPVRLPPVPVRRSGWDTVRMAVGEDGLARAREIVEEARRAALEDAQAGFADAARRLETLAAALPEEEREEALEDAERRLVNPASSLRKLEKQLRQHVLRESVSGRAAEIGKIAPAVRVVDTGGSVRFEAEREVMLDVAGEPLAVRLVATQFGGDLERLFLTGDAQAFVDAVMPVLDAELDRMAAAAEQMALDVESYVEKRKQWPLYDLAALRRIVREEIERADPLEPDSVLERIRERTRRLDFEARERAYVREMVHERHLVAYKDFFPKARQLDRELTFFVGPTNSGKTWHALNALAAEESGVYLAPLRLLALEGQEEIEARGRRASFITGEERDIRPGARFVASTIEMLNPNEVYDAAVIDEVQLLTDEDRGWAWCQALVGVAAKRVFMTGSRDVVPLVQAMAEYLDEPLELVELERFTPLEALPDAQHLRQVEPGTAIIAFSRRDVLGLKAQLERKFRVAVIYGNLTPEVRREEARRFRSGEAQVLVATDAIAMGLNLPIKTILFSTLKKWNGKEEVILTPAETLQIGGRAGRYGKYEEGFVGALRPEDVRRIQRVLSEGFVLKDRPLETRVRPGADHVELISSGLDSDSLARTLETFQRGMTFDSPMLKPGVTDDMLKLAQIMDRHPELPMAERLSLAAAPIDTRSPSIVDAYTEWMDAFAHGEPVGVRPLPPWFRKAEVESDQELQAAEYEAKKLTAYAWLAYRYPDYFPDLEKVQKQRRDLDRFIERGLARRSAARHCAECGKRLPPRSRYTTCRDCFRRTA